VSLSAFSYGGGVQSTAALVLAAERTIDFPLFLFANVGEDSENPRTLDFVEEFAKPYAARMGIELVELHKYTRYGEPITIRSWLDRTERSVGIPVYMANGAPGNRLCTYRFKIIVVDKELKRRGVTKHEKAVLGLGISTDEWKRMRKAKDDDVKVFAYPLIDLDLDREACTRLIERAGLPVPPKSSCYFCPFHRIGEWQDMRRNEPDLFAKSVALEDMLNERRAVLGKDAVYLTNRKKPLSDAIAITDSDEGETSCDIGGYCHV
jgi:hypothetical protein